MELMEKHEIEAEFDYQSVRRNVRKFAVASAFILIGTFLTVWVS